MAYLLHVLFNLKTNQFYSLNCFYIFQLSGILGYPYKTTKNADSLTRNDFSGSTERNGMQFGTSLLL